jgi:hypothetical protein
VPGLAGGISLRRQQQLLNVQTDAHAHILDYGFMVQLPLANTTSIQGDQAKPIATSPNNFSDVVDRVKQYILDHPDIRDDKTKWISGMGWDQTKWPGAQFPTAVSFPVIKFVVYFSLYSGSSSSIKILF